MHSDGKGLTHCVWRTKNVTDPVTNFVGFPTPDARFVNGRRLLGRPFATSTIDGESWIYWKEAPDGLEK